MGGATQAWLAKKMGPRPRHLVFHPSLPVAYVLTECGNCLSWHTFDEVTGELGTALGKIRTLSPFEEASCFVRRFCCLPTFNAAAEIEVSLDGRFIYVSNRGFGWRGESSVA